MKRIRKADIFPSFSTRRYIDPIGERMKMTTYLKLVFLQARLSIRILEIEEKISKETDYDRYLLSKNFAPSY